MTNIFRSIASFFSKIFGSAPTWATKASTVITVVAPLVETVVTLTAGESSAQETAAIINEVQADLNTLSAVVKDGKDAASVKDVIASLTGHLNQLLDAGHVKNADTRAKIQVVVNSISTELQAVLTLLPTTN